MKDLNVRPETIKLLEENLLGKLFDIGLAVICLHQTPRAKTTNAKTNKLDYIKKKSAQQRKSSTK